MVETVQGGAMADPHDVAACILRQQSMSSMKLQKLVYYSQAWHLAWEERPLFDASIEAWANGPVVRTLFNAHRGQYEVGPGWPPGDPDALSTDERATVDRVLQSYGDLTGRQLSILPHSERPWRDARTGLGPTDWCDEEVSPESMQMFYAALDADDSAQPIESIDWNDSDAGM